MKVKKFDTKVQHLKYEVLREVARHAFDGTLLEHYNDIPKTIVKGPKATMRCCIYKERAILAERVKLATGGDKSNPNVIEVIDIACDECPLSGYTVTESCRGCIAHRCEEVCKRGAITFDDQLKAHIDKDKCVECGMCAKVCPYSAIVNQKRPCENACKVNAISMAEGTKAAHIDNDKCISCGACVYQCPFGAISDKSYILDVIQMIKDSDHNKNFKLHAVVAPSIASQFRHVKLGQVISGLKEMGFYSVVEAAWGADLVSYRESQELVEKGFLTSSCCPAFVDYIKKAFPSLVEHISHNLSPMASIAQCMKQQDEACKIVFIGPCTAKKAEIKLDTVSPYIDSAITFEELQALFDALEIDLEHLSVDVLDNASYFGRIFARSGGLTDAVAQALKEQGVTDFEFKPIACDGIEACKKALMLASKNVLPNNFIEGMACNGGCIGGAGCLTHGVKDKNEVDEYGREAFEETITDSISVLINHS